MVEFEPPFALPELENHSRQKAPVNRQGSVTSATIDFENVRNKIQDITNLALQVYNNLLDIGVAREQARMVLPQNMYTEFYATVNLRNLPGISG